MPALRCPKCRAEMQSVAEPDVTVEVCPTCGGRLLDRGELNQLATGMAGNIEYCTIDDAARPEGLPDRECPRCPGQVMQKVGLLGLVDVVFDFCPQCESFFVEAGEIEAMNETLRELSPGKQGEEYRAFRGGRLVRGDLLETVVLAPGFLGLQTRPVPARYVQLAVYFRKPLGAGLHVAPEKTGTKLRKIFGLFHGQDLLTGDGDFDGAFLVEASDESKARSILSAEVRQAMVDFASRAPRIVSEPGTLEVQDTCLVYKEGPYAGEFQVDWDGTAQAVVEDLVGLAERMERAG